MANTAPDDFVRDHLGPAARRYRTSSPVLISTSARAARAPPTLLREMGQGQGFGVTVVDQVTDDGSNAPFSSSSIRSALRRGHVPRGRP